MTDSPDPSRRRFLAAVSVGTAVVAGVEIGSAYVDAIPGSCRDETGPSATFRAERSASELALVHDGGDTFTDANTVALLLAFEDLDAGRTVRLNWSQASAALDPANADDDPPYPVRYGDGVTVD